MSKVCEVCLYIPGHAFDCPIRIGLLEADRDRFKKALEQIRDNYLLMGLELRGVAREALENKE